MRNAELEHLIPAPEAHSLPTFEELSLANEDIESEDSAEIGDEVKEWGTSDTQSYAQSSTQSNIQGNTQNNTQGNTQSKPASVAHSDTGGLHIRGMGTTTSTEKTGGGKAPPHTPQDTPTQQQPLLYGGLERENGPLRVSLPASASKAMIPPAYDKVHTRSTATYTGTVVDFAATDRDVRSTSKETHTSTAYSNPAVDRVGRRLAAVAPVDAGAKANADTALARSRSGSGSILQAITKRAQRLTTARNHPRTYSNSEANNTARSCATDTGSGTDAGHMLEMQDFTPAGDGSVPQSETESGEVHHARTGSTGGIGIAQIGGGGVEDGGRVKGRSHGVGTRRDVRGKHSRTKSLNALQILKKTVLSEGNGQDTA
ncbi:hypothetical protein SARC_13076 [Sphaeroforma arctica JP610]|uniref:Uncharacterized protein n=1 Tax=Sphaeroforma arctica JP610 TaxID=667725 RepID=A0A0L0FCB1_9EUKA|nr:hypothetical protein SARC_13076 [Sphaeroforma arctica JP610]KNC74374.1 hypothetical protein SARC_13076 [Sphaeroforma arctica JP610]|eukprot:XP_014148276.1 hypothetical protein SARC_13076 [Sphaeroforma arctica JP610]